MGALAIMVIAFAGYIIMYQLYGKFIGAKIFALSGAAKTWHCSRSQSIENLTPVSRNGGRRGCSGDN